MLDSDDRLEFNVRYDNRRHHCNAIEIRPTWVYAMTAIGTAAISWKYALCERG